MSAFLLVVAFHIGTFASHAIAQADDLALLVSKLDGLAPLVAKLSPGDRSVLRDGIYEGVKRKGDDVQFELMTSEGSANDVLWSALSVLGLMKQLPLPVDFPPETKLKLFALTAEGKEQIPVLLPKAIAP